MSLEVKLRIVMNENARGETMECIESIRKPEDEVCYVFPPRISSKRSSSTVIQFIDSEESRKQLNHYSLTYRPLQKHYNNDG
jgi:hypothetical protein